MISKIMTLVDVGMTASTYVGARKQGDSVGSAAAQTISTTAVSAMIPTLTGQLAYMGLTVGYDMMMQNAKANAEVSKDLKNIGSGYVGSGKFDMSNAGYTMRQRSIEKMRSTGMNINSVLGNEARNYMRSSQRAW